MENIFDVRGATISSSLGKRLDDCFLTVRPGDIVALSGPNGAGKTTLLRAMLGLIPLTSGTIFVHGRVMTPVSGAVLRRTVGYVPQVLEVNDRAPILSEEVVLMGMYGKKGLFHVPSEEDRRRCRALAALLGLVSLLAQPFGSLSGGEKKRVLIARALLPEPDVLLLDEVSAWLDPAARATVVSQVRALHRERALTVILVSHHADELTMVANRTVSMEQGRITGETVQESGGQGNL